MKKKSAFTLMEVMVAMVLVGILSILCASMLVFSYSMFNKVVGQKDSVTQYKTFRFKAERVFRNMTRVGPIIGEIIDEGARAGQPPANAAEDLEAIKFNVDYYHYPYALTGRIYARKYNEPYISGDGLTVTTKYVFPPNLAASTVLTHIDPGHWSGFVGRNVSVYSCLTNEKLDEDYKRYMFRLETSTITNFSEIAMYEWELTNNQQIKIDSYDGAGTNQVSVFGPQGVAVRQPYYPPESTGSKEIVLRNVVDFQVTARLSNLYMARIIRSGYSDIAVVRLYIKLEDDNYTQYTSDLIFANKSLYANTDTFFTTFEKARIRP
ncbi:MAG: type II secretion system GspH family protein [Endomicrobium sp.]|jgi:prepilin-type N-terminal cleavage/methylation domain-containing protein|nr:type II secretion system GspH family protein [Endomicrobium sp.]